MLQHFLHRFDAQHIKRRALENMLSPTYMRIYPDPTVQITIILSLIGMTQIIVTHFNKVRLRSHQKCQNKQVLIKECKAGSDGSNVISYPTQSQQ